MFKRLFVYAKYKRNPKKLIQGAVDAARGAAMPPLLVFAKQCQAWGALPDTGGYLEQDASLIAKINVSTNVYGFMLKLQTLTGEKIHSLSIQERKLWAALIREGYW